MTAQTTRCLSSTILVSSCAHSAIMPILQGTVLTTAILELLEKIQRRRVKMIV